MAPPTHASGDGTRWAGTSAAGAIAGVSLGELFRSIQLSTVAIGLLTFSSFPVFVTVLEPLMLGTRWRWRDGGMALLVLLGVALVVPEYRLEAEATLGAIWGCCRGYRLRCCSC